MDIIRDVNLQPFSNKHLFGEHPSVLPPIGATNSLVKLDRIR